LCSGPYRLPLVAVAGCWAGCQPRGADAPCLAACSLGLACHEPESSGECSCRPSRPMSGTVSAVDSAQQATPGGQRPAGHTRWTVPSRPHPVDSAQQATPGGQRPAGHTEQQHTAAARPAPSAPTPVG
jgi:hypothetical protein